MIIFVTLNSCEQSQVDSTKLIHKKNINNQEEPKEPCDVVSWGNLPVITHGYIKPEHEDILVETYIKNSNFNTIIKRFELKNNAKISDINRQQRSFSLPSEITSKVDIKIIIGNEKYLITEVKTGWVPRFGNEFIGYECAIGNFRINGDISGGNIILSNPTFKYP
jgi:hypothetical protein